MKRENRRSFYVVFQIDDSKHTDSLFELDRKDQDFKTKEISNST